MPSKSKQTMSRELTASYPWGGEQYANVAIAYRSRIWNDPISRPKPPFVYANPTELPKQSRTVSSACVASEGSPGSVYRRYFHTPLYVYTNPPNLNWEGKIREKTENLTTDLSGAVAEFHKTATGFTHFVNTARDIKRRLRGPGKKLDFCQVSSARLAVQYGIKPVVNDLFAAFGALQSSLGSNPVFRVHAKVSGSSEVDTNWGYNTYTGIHNRSQSAVAYFEWLPGTDTFTLGNPAEWAWELIPFSFVVDWGIPIGDYISSFDALRNTRFISGSLTTKDRINVEVSNSQYNVEKLGHYYHESHYRERLNSIPMSDFPSFDLKATKDRVLNSLALLHQLKSCK